MYIKDLTTLNSIILRITFLFSNVLTTKHLLCNKNKGMCKERVFPGGKFFKLRPPLKRHLLRSPPLFRKGHFEWGLEAFPVASAGEAGWRKGGSLRLRSKAPKELTRIKTKEERRSVLASCYENASRTARSGLVDEPACPRAPAMRSGWVGGKEGGKNFREQAKAPSPKPRPCNEVKRLGAPAEIP